MILNNNPFDEIAFTKQTKILLDACILLTLIDEDDNMYSSCKKEVSNMQEKDTQFFVSNVVLAEVINRTIDKLFKNDIQSIHTQINPLNSLENLYEIILNGFNEYERNIILNLDNQNEKDNFRKIIKLPYTKRFNKINKNKLSIDRDVLQIYFNESIRLVTEIQRKYDLKLLVINESMMNLAKDLSCKYMLGINDAQHLATAIGHRMHYILSMDGDFKFVTEKTKVEFLKIS